MGEEIQWKKVSYCDCHCYCYCYRRSHRRPSDRHSRGANITFADGHSQIFKWQEPMTGKHGYDAPALKPIDRDFDKLAPTIATKR